MDLSLFADEYIPRNILYRDQELASLIQVFHQFTIAHNPINYLVFGYTGSGKTLLIRKLINSAPEKMLYLNAARKKTALKILKDISGTTYNEIDKVLDKAIESLQQNPRIVIIDELNQLRDPAIFLDCLNTLYRDTHVPFILISNKRDFAEKIADDARLTLFFHKLNLRPYNAEEIQGILKDRIALLDPEDQARIDSGFLNYISALSSREGSVRFALAALRHAIATNDFSYACADKVNDDVRVTDWKDFFDSRSSAEINFLKLLVENCDSRNSITAQELYKKEFFKDLSPSRLSNLISVFQNEHGLIDVEYLNAGRSGGRFRSIRFSSEKIYQTIVSLFESRGIYIVFDKRLNTLSDFIKQ
jgi:Cdc6-like AAA superfamily ATPase